MSRVVCISGKRYFGKDTLARLMVQGAAQLGVAVTTYAFADESKRMFAALRPEVDLAKLLGDRAYKETWRPQLTAFTVEALAADPLVFVRRVMARIAESPGPALITDLRLRCELDHLRSVGNPFVVRLTRSDEQRAASGWRYDADKDTHHTETELDDPALWNEEIENDGTEEELGIAAFRLVGKLLRQ